MGVSVENEKVIHRIDELRTRNAKTNFLYLEPLIGPLQNMNLENIDWAIVGGESGRKSRPIKVVWVWDIKQQCDDQGVAFFFKQRGGVNKKKTVRELGGRTDDEMPAKKTLQEIEF
jgi:protein gp37